MGTPQRPINQSKGNAVVARSVPFGLVAARSHPAEATKWAYELGRTCAAITHGHPTAQDAAGAYAALIGSLCKGTPLHQTTFEVTTLLTNENAAQEVIDHLDSARGLAGEGTTNPTWIDYLPRHWHGLVAEEALAIGLYAALAAPTFTGAVQLAVNHSGNSDSAGAICGGLYGAAHGLDALPEEWINELEGHQVISTVAEDIHRIMRPGYRVTRSDDWRYPGL